MNWLAFWLSLVLVVAVLWTGLRFLPAGADGRMPLPYVIALQRFLWIPLALVAAVGVVSRLWLIAVLAVMVIPLTLLGVLPYWRSTSRHAEDNRRDAIRLATLNCRFGRADPQAIVALVRTAQIDVLALQELTGELLAALEAAGLNSLLPHCTCGVAKPGDNGGFNGLWCRMEPSEIRRSSVDIMAADVPVIELSVSGGDLGRVRFTSAHTLSPMRSCRQWSAGVLALRSLAGNEPTVVLGDLNSGLDHPSFRATLRDGLHTYFHDAALEWARGTHPTYPSWLPWPRIVLDHILATPDMSFRDVRTLQVPGTDHHALLATLCY